MELLEEINNFRGTPFQCLETILVFNHRLFHKVNPKVSVSFDKRRTDATYLEADIKEVAADWRVIGQIKALGKPNNKSIVWVFYQKNLPLVEGWWKQIRTRLSEEGYIDIEEDGIEYLERRRTDFLHRLYELVGGISSVEVILRDVVDGFNWTEEEIFTVRDYWTGEGCVQILGIGGLNGQIKMTHLGVKRIEDELAEDYREQKEASAKPWNKIPDHGYDREMLRLWWMGFSASEIAEKLDKDIEAKTITNKLVDLRRTYRGNIVPYHKDRSRKRKELGIKSG